jgi:hypothetical protein
VIVDAFQLPQSLTAVLLVLGPIDFGAAEAGEQLLAVLFSGLGVVVEVDLLLGDVPFHFIYESLDKIDISLLMLPPRRLL